MLRTPITDPVPSTSHATNKHDQSIAVHTQHCAHKPQAQTLHTCTGCSRTRTDRTHAPSTRHLHVRSIAQQHAQPCLSQLSTPQSDLWVPASSSSRSRLFLDTIRSSTLTIAANARCADSSRSAAPASLQPAAAAAAPAQHSPRSAAGLSRDALRTYARATLPTRHVPYPYPLSTNRAREEGGVADYVTLRGWHRPSPDARESFSKSQMFTVSNFQTSQIFKRLTFSEFSWTQAEPARLDPTPRSTHAPTAPRKGGGGAGLGGPLPAHVGRVRRRPRRLPSRRPRTCMLPAPNPRTPRVYPTVARCPRVQSPPGASLVDAGPGPPGGGRSAGDPFAVSERHTSGSVLQVPNRGTHICSSQLYQ